MLRGSYHQNPIDFPNLKTFGSARSTYNALILTKNSPLKSIFTKVALKFQERGQYDRSSIFWQGGSIPQTGGLEADSMVLTSGQVALIFCVLFVSMFLAFLTLICEILSKKWTERAKGEEKFFETRLRNNIIINLFPKQKKILGK